MNHNRKKQIRLLYKGLSTLGFLVGSIGFLYAWFTGLQLRSYEFFDLTIMLWKSQNGIFLTKIAALFTAVIEAMYGLYIGFPVIIIDYLKPNKFLEDVILIIPVLFQSFLIYLEEQSSETPTLMNLELLGLKPLFGKKEFNLKKDFCFYLGPFSEKITPIYLDCVAEPLRKIGFNIRRADEIFGVRPVMDDIWDAINESFIIIADVTGRNPNVMYEIGMAHTVGKRVIIITQSIDDVPFDLKHIRCIVYENSEKGLNDLKSNLLITIQHETGQLTIRELALRKDDKQ